MTPSPAGSQAGDQTSAGEQAAAVDPAPVSASQLSFRVMLRDETRNHVLEEGEQLSVEVDVHNEGPASAQGVELHFTGTPGLVEQFTTPLRIGELPAGEHRRVTVSGTVPKLDGVEQAEVMLALKAAGPGVRTPTPKKFVIAVRPLGEDLEVLSVGVDQPPKRVKGFEQTNAVGIAIGIGSFRDATLASSRFAARDAVVVASYLTHASGVPAKQVRVLTDGQALRDDLVAVFETWLPEQAKPRGTVYVYVSGRAVVEPDTGAVLLVPYDGKPRSQQRLYALSRLQAALAQLPIERAILILDVSLEPTGGISSKPPVPRWDPEDAGIPPGKIIHIIGNTAIQDAHEYQAGQHGLFTYYLLKGLRGEADSKQTGRVLLRDLCRYVETRVQQAAQAEFGNGQAPICRPSPSRILALEQAPVARLK